MTIELIHIIEAGNRLGEGVLWDARTSTLWWTDIQAARLYRLHWPTHVWNWMELPERLGAFALTDDPDVIIAAFASGFARFHLQTQTCHWLARPEQGYAGTRFNDGRVDRQGRFWCGTMVEAGTATDDEGNPVQASLYCLEGSTAIPMLKGIQISNSLCWNRAGTAMYFGDSPEKVIRVFDFNPNSGQPGTSRVFASLEGDGEPDGSCIDEEDCLWNAEWGAGRVTRYRPDGSMDLQIVLPVTQPTCVGFGGPDNSFLCVTTARDGLSEEQLRQQPLAGHLFIYKTGVRGSPVNQVKLVAG